MSKLYLASLIFFVLSFSVSSQNVELSINYETDGDVGDILLSPNNNYLLVKGRYSHRIPILELWHAKSGIKMGTTNNQTIIFSETGEKLATSTYKNGKTSDWKTNIINTRTGKIISIVQGHQPLAFSIDGRFLINRLYSNTIGIWNVSSSKLINTIRISDSSIDYNGMTNDGKKILTSYWHTRQIIKANEVVIELWGIPSGEKLDSFSLKIEHRTHRSGISLLPNGKVILILGVVNETKTKKIENEKEVISFFDIETKSIISTIQVDRYLFWEISSNCKFLFLAKHSQIDMYDINTGKLLWSHNLPKEFGSCNSHRLIKVLSSPFNDNNERIWTGSLNRKSIILNEHSIKTGQVTDSIICNFNFKIKTASFYPKKNILLVKGCPVFEGKNKNILLFDTKLKKNIKHYLSSKRPNIHSVNPIGKDLYLIKFLEKIKSFSFLNSFQGKDVELLPGWNPFLNVTQNGAYYWHQSSKLSFFEVRNKKKICDFEMETQAKNLFISPNKEQLGIFTGLKNQKLTILNLENCNQKSETILFNTSDQVKAKIGKTQEIKNIPIDRLKQGIFSPDNQHVLVHREFPFKKENKNFGVGAKLKLINISSGNVIDSFIIKEKIRGIAFSGNGYNALAFGDTIHYYNIKAKKLGRYKYSSFVGKRIYALDDGLHFLYQTPSSSYQSNSAALGVKTYNKYQILKIDEETEESSMTIYDKDHNKIVSFSEIGIIDIPFKPGASFFESLKVDKTQKRAIGIELNNTIHIWDITNGKSLLSLFFLDDENWVAMSQENYYTCSKGAIGYLGFQNELESYSFEQFDLKYNRPDLVLGHLGAPDSLLSIYKKAYQKRLEKMNFSENMLSSEFHVPEIEILSNDIPLATTNSILTINIKAIDTKQNLDRINIYVNDIPIYGIQGINLRNKQLNKYEHSIKLTLSKGENKIQVSALNQTGGESLKETIYVTYESKNIKPDLYIIALGVDKYKDSTFNLDYPVKDAKDLVRTFRFSESLYNEIIVKNLYDKQVTKESITNLKEILKKSQVDDKVIVFYSGHGIVDEELDYYLATSDTEFSHPKLNAIPFEVIENLLDFIPARNKLLLIDACHSGEIDKEGIELLKKKNTRIGKVNFKSFDTDFLPFKLDSYSSFELMRSLFVDLRRRTGATIISSASGMELSIEGDKWKNGVFTYYLLKGLSEGKANLNGDYQVTVSELQQYLAIEVPKQTANQQKPTFRIENISNDWRIW